MCNPPFYSSREEIEKSTTEKEFSPSAVCTGADTEMITAGGESAFVRHIVTESLIYRTKCRYTLVSDGFDSGCQRVYEL
jgi:23S rRNA A1618 N6-methylase RlmF